MREYERCWTCEYLIKILGIRRTQNRELVELKVDLEDFQDMVEYIVDLNQKWLQNHFVYICKPRGIKKCHLNWRKLGQIECEGEENTRTRSAHKLCIRKIRFEYD